MGKIKNFFSSLSRAGIIVLVIWVLCLIALISFFVIRNNNKSDESDKAPEVAQIYEPSIGSPLPADTPGTSATTDVASENAKENSGEVAGDSTTTASTEMVAPHTGIDPNEPVAYQNSSLNFSANLPAGTKVDEQGSRIIFTSKQGSLLYIVSTSKADGENLQSLSEQLRNSPGTSNITETKFAKYPALTFTTKDYGNGITFIANEKIYYLLGNNKYFATFKTI